MTNHELLPSAEHFEHLKQGMLGAVAADDRRRTRRHRLIALGIAGSLVAGTTAGAIAVARATQGQINNLVECYASADLGSEHATSVYAPGDLNAKTPSPIEDRIALAKDQCAAAWRIGSFSPGGASRTEEFPIPNLEACQLPDARLAVFPSDLAVRELCSRLGLTIPHE